ncbi:MAG: glycosyltransferase family 1 protein [Patescibacteria group bacterium]|nr:glycosyltransferase family 1 protein [Patescibacteria group bacterium]
MIIGIDASRANRRRKTGTEWYSYYLIRWLAKLDHKNNYILYTNKPLDGGLLDLGTKNYTPGESIGKIRFDKQGYQIIKSPGNNFKAKVLRWPFTYFWTQGRLSLEMLFYRPDVLFIPAHALPLIHPKKSVLTIHDIGYNERGDAYNRHDMGRGKEALPGFLNFLVRIFTCGKYQANALDYLRWSSNHALKKSKQIISISNFTKKTITEIYGREKNITVIPNGYNAYLYKKINNKDKIEQTKKRYGIDGSYLFYIGRIERKKNISALIEAYAIMKDQNKNIKEKLVLVGDASYGFDEIKYVIRQFDLLNDVIMPGWVNEDDIPYLYNGATAFVFPSLYEGFGIPLLQAMACETPIVASNKTSIPEVTAGAALLFNPDFVCTMADALSQICQGKKLREKLINKGKERVQDFNWKKTAEKTLKVLIN